MKNIKTIEELLEVIKTNEGKLPPLTLRSAVRLLRLKPKAVVAVDR